MRQQLDRMGIKHGSSRTPYMVTIATETVDASVTETFAAYSPCQTNIQQGAVEPMSFLTTAPFRQKKVPCLPVSKPEAVAGERM
jgi:hypothetical protein